MMPIMIIIPWARPAMKAASSPPARLFIYGSLITGTPDRRLNRAMSRRLARARPAVIRARLYDLGPYPGAVPSTTGQVYGRLISITDPVLLRRLDRYEDYFPHASQSSEFRRVITYAVCLTNRRPVACWVYFYNREIAEEVPLASFGLSEPET